MLLTVLAISFLYPLFFMFINSIKTNSEYMKDKFSVNFAGADWENYSIIFKNFKLGKYFCNTLYVTVLKLAFQLFFTIIASFAFAKLRFRGKNFIYGCVMIVMFIPFQVIMIPLYVMLAKLKLINTYFAYITIGATLGLPGSILLMTTYFRGIPNEIIDAAKIDGAGYFRTVFGVAVPSCIPAVAISTIMSFINGWNDMLLSMLIIKDNNKQLIMPALSLLVGQFEKDIPLQLTGMLLATLPAIVIYIILQKQILMGVSDGAVK